LSIGGSICAKRSLPGNGSNLDKRWGFPLKKIVGENPKGGAPPMADLIPYEPNRGKKTFGGNMSKDKKHKCYLSPLAYLTQCGKV